MNKQAFWPTMLSYQNTVHLINMGQADEDQTLASSTKPTLVMSGYIFNGEALSKTPRKVIVRLQFGDDGHEMDILHGSGGDFDSVKLKAFYAMILVEDKRLSAGQSRVVFQHHSILLEQKFRNSDQFPPVVRRFHRVGVFCIEIFEGNDLNREFINQLRHQKEKIEIT
jgi:hypothetical protein